MTANSSVQCTSLNYVPMLLLTLELVLLASVITHQCVILIIFMQWCHTTFGVFNEFETASYDSLPFILSKCSPSVHDHLFRFSILKIFSCLVTLASVQNPGQFKVHSAGLTWKRQGGGKTIKIDKDGIHSVKWTKVPKTYQLEFRIKDGLFYKFIGFREQVNISLSLFHFNIIEIWQI